MALPRALFLLGLVAGGVGLAVTVLLALLAHHCLAGTSSQLAGVLAGALLNVEEGFVLASHLKATVSE